MKDNFDLKKYLKDNKVIEKSNKYVAATLKEDKKVEEKKPLKEGKDALREKIKNMVMAEMADMEDSMEEGYGKYEEDNVDEASCGYEEDGMDEAMSKKKKSLDDGIKTADSYMKEDVGDMSKSEFMDLANKAKEELLDETQNMDEAAQLNEVLFDLFTPETLSTVWDIAQMGGSGVTRNATMGEMGYLFGWLAQVTGLGLGAGAAINKLVKGLKSAGSRLYKSLVGSKEMGEKAAVKDLEKKAEKAGVVTEIEKDESEDNAETEETEEEVEVVDAEDAPAETDTPTDTGGIMGNLEAAIEKARELGDEKLIDQIGNTITFYTRQYISK